MNNRSIWREFILLTIFTILPTLVFSSTVPERYQRNKILKKTSRIQIPFIENIGQIEEKQVSFYAKTFGATVFVEKNGHISYSLPLKNRGGITIKEIISSTKDLRILHLPSCNSMADGFFILHKKVWSIQRLCAKTEKFPVCHSSVKRPISKRFFALGRPSEGLGWTAYGVTLRDPVGGKFKIQIFKVLENALHCSELEKVAYNGIY